MATTHIDYRKIDYDQLIDKPITRVASSVNPNTLTTAGVYDRGDGNRFIVTVDGQNILQVIEKKDGYETRSSTDGGTTWSAWDTIEFTKSGDIDAEDVNYDNTTSELQATNVQAAIDEIDTSIDDIKEDITEIKNIIEVTEMEEPSEENEGNIIQYKGETNANFTQGYFYKCVSDGQDPATYSWVRIDVQPAGAGDDHEFITLTAYNQLTPEQKAEKVYMITEDGVPGSGLTAGAGIDITNNVISADMTTAVYDNTTSGATATNVQDAIDEVFQSVSNGKTLIAAAITDKGVSTAASDSFQTMATNIRNIKTATSTTYDLLYPTSEQGFRFFVRARSDDSPAVVDKKNILGKDVYMLSALGYNNSATDYGDIKIVIIEEDGSVIEKTKHITYRESGHYDVSLKYYPTSNTIAVVNSRNYAFYSIDFDTYAEEGVSGNYDDTYLNDIQHNGSIDFVQSTGERGGTIYASMLPVSIDGPIKVINDNVGSVPAFESQIESLFFTAPYTGNYHITGKAYNTNNKGATEISLTGGTLVEGVSDIKVDDIGEGDIDCIYNVTLGNNVYIKNLKRSYGAGYGDSFTVEFVS